MRFFRLNCEQDEKDKVLALLAEEGFSCRGVSGSSLVMAVTHEPFPIGSSLAHYFGYIYIQDISSILPVMLLNPPRDSIVLDLCASPGSKTGQLARAVGPGGLVAANEPNPSRLATLRANLKRLNLINVITSGYNGQDLALKGLSFDCILLDVPCSGWGTLNKNPGAARVWAGNKLPPLIALQKMLLATASKLLSPGGRLVYSTCTTNILENEEQIEWAQKNLSLKSNDPGPFLPEPNEFPDIEITGPGMMRVKGSVMGGQDFFMAALTTVPGAGPENRIARHVYKKPRGEQVAFDMNMRQLKGGDLRDFSGNVFFVPDKAWNLLNMGFSARGMLVGKKKKEKFIISPRMRVFLPEDAAGTRFNAKDLEHVKSLVSGRSFNFTSSGSLAGFYWKDLGLGWLKVRNKRILWSDR
jgi:16S rRNA C967 or C1407 C5-methylase (RsmB/RsmF family)